MGSAFCVLIRKRASLLIHAYRAFFITDVLLTAF